MVYEQKKRKQNRIAFRMVGVLFFGFALFRLISMMMGNNNHVILSTVFVAGGLGFGFYLIKESMRVSAYNMRYELQEDKIIIQNKKGTFTYSYDEIEDLNLIHPDETMQIDVITFKVNHTPYAVSMIGKKEFAEDFFHYIEKRSAN
ncbi:MAG: hypothetical protein IJA10_07605 [Lachnospiraceae bacterium]|nr:hypothetical protein [Lachnospiraceae bacterium]